MRHQGCWLSASIAGCLLAGCGNTSGGLSRTDSAPTAIEGGASGNAAGRAGAGSPGGGASGGGVSGEGSGAAGSGPDIAQAGLPAIGAAGIGGTGGVSGNSQGGEGGTVGGGGATGCGGQPSQPYQCCNTQQVGQCSVQQCGFTDVPPIDPAVPERFSDIAVRVLSSSTEVYSTRQIRVHSERDPASVLSGGGTLQTVFSPTFEAGDVLHVSAATGGYGLPAFERIVTLPSAVALNAKSLPFLQIPLSESAPPAVPTSNEPELYWTPQAEGELHYVLKATFKPDLHGVSSFVHCSAPLSAGHLVLSSTSISASRTRAGVYAVRRSSETQPEVAAVLVLAERTQGF